MITILHSDDKTQSDYELGALTFSVSSAMECFELGKLAAKLEYHNFEAVSGPWNDGCMIRVPLTKRKIR